MKITNNHVYNWLGSDVSKQDLIEILADIANGNYSAEELKKDIEGALGFNKLTLVKDLLTVRDKTLKEEFDAVGATRAVAQISKMMGYDAATKIEADLEIKTIVKKIGE
jgi:butyrate kinase